MTQIDVLESAVPRRAAHRFLVLRQDPVTRAYQLIGVLGRDAECFTFSYSAGAASDTSLQRLPGFADPQDIYRSRALFPTFANRVMSPRRDNYAAYLRALGITDDQPDPFEVLSRTWGERATDTLQLLPVPEVDGSGRLASRFLLHGGRYVDPDGTELSRVRVGDRLSLVPEPSNPVDPSALLVCRSPEGNPLGYAPRPLTSFMHALWDIDAPLTLTAEHVNLPSDLTLSNQMRLLVRLEAQVPVDFDVDAALAC